ncbi:DUF952 domain-containing protein [Devosia sp.]|uniref:DUF952 domain-containing protein n=1 Tax=Devosia sp. TaxID=1871048 RepID=UPI003BA9EA4D
MQHPNNIYKVTTGAVFEASRAAGRFLGMPVDHADGYLHFSTADQLRETLRLYFAGEADLVLFAVASADVSGALRWEPSRGGQLFPHLFGDLPMGLVGNTATISVAADGSVTLPEWVK